MSADGRFAITLIAFIGSVFSPYYAWAGRRQPDNHVCINVALYGPGVARWAMTERGRRAVERDEAHLRIGPSALEWQGDSLTIRIDEICCPIPRRVRGMIRVTPTMLPTQRFALDPAGAHHWQPIAPTAHLSVMLDQPALDWTGAGYLDSNFGSEPLEAGFRHWTWSRAHRQEEAIVFYDAERRDGGQTSLALGFGPDGRMRALAPLPWQPLPRTGWRLACGTRADAARPAILKRRLEDTPFYARSLLASEIYGTTVTALHETLSLDRFRHPIIRAMLPFRMPRQVF